MNISTTEDSQTSVRKTGFTGTWIPHWLYQHEDLKSADRELLAMVMSLGQGGYVCVSYIARVMHMARETISRRLSKLEIAGYVRRTRRMDGASNQVVLTEKVCVEPTCDETVTQPVTKPSHDNKYIKKDRNADGELDACQPELHAKTAQQSEMNEQDVLAWIITILNGQYGYLSSVDEACIAESLKEYIHQSVKPCRSHALDWCNRGFQYRQAIDKRTATIAAARDRLATTTADNINHRADELQTGSDRMADLTDTSWADKYQFNFDA